MEGPACYRKRFCTSQPSSRTKPGRFFSQTSSYLVPRTQLFQKLSHGGLELTVAPERAFSQSFAHGQIHGSRMHLHQRPIVGNNTRKRQAEGRAIYQLHAGGKDDPAGGRLAHNLAEMERTITFSEIFAVRKRVAIGNQNCR